MTTPSASKTIFHRIVAGEIPAKKLFEDAEMIAIEDIHPAAPFHVLIIPKKPIKDMNEAADAHLLGRMMIQAARLAWDHGYAESGYRIVVNTNCDLRAIPYLHFHVLAGRTFAWPPG